MSISGLCTHAYSVLHICTQTCIHMCSHTYKENEKVLSGKIVFSWLEEVHISVLWVLTYLSRFYICLFWTLNVVVTSDPTEFQHLMSICNVLFANLPPEKPFHFLMALARGRESRESTPKQHWKAFSQQGKKVTLVIYNTVLQPFQEFLWGENEFQFFHCREQRQQFEQLTQLILASYH